MKRKIRRFLCGAVLSAMLFPLMMADAEEGTVYWVNPDGGIYYHLDRNCRSIHPRYLPLSVSVTEKELEELPPDTRYLPCNICVLDEDYVPAAEAEPVSGNEPESLESILQHYAESAPFPSDRLQIVQNQVNFRETPGGNVLGRLQSGTILECLDETQYKGELWYHARSQEYGDGYVVYTFAKPLWNNLNVWPLSEKGDILTDNMLLFAYWMGTYQIDHGLSAIENISADRQLSIAPMNVRGDQSLIPEDMKILLAEKLFEYGFICKTDAYGRLQDSGLSFEDRNQTAEDVLLKHYGTDDLWEIITENSIAVFIHVFDLHARPELSAGDQELLYALQKKIIDEH